MFNIFVIDYTKILRELLPTIIVFLVFLLTLNAAKSSGSLYVFNGQIFYLILRHFNGLVTAIFPL